MTWEKGKKSLFQGGFELIHTKMLFSDIQSTAPFLFCSVFEVDRSASVTLVGPAFSYSHGLGLGSDKISRETPFPHVLSPRGIAGHLPDIN